MEYLCRFGLGLALCLFWLTFGTPAQADAISESPFKIDPPPGWKRDVIEDGTVRLVDPTNHDCLIFINPHASNIGHEKDDSWLRSVFDIERDTVIKQLSALGAVFLNEVDRPTIERIANGTYAIHGSFLMKAIENGEQKTGNIRILLLLRRESIQRLLSVADYSACEDDVIVSFLNKAITNIESVNASAEKGHASPRKIQQSHIECISNCSRLFSACNNIGAPPLYGPTCGEQDRVCHEKCPPPPNVFAR